ncbi:uncharacterized protein DNG_01574 [Cephalotrichum gorgonifer]|uniref:Gem-associated protein 5 TPR domain-containing protein n=1 Tax=Cephalotrichum gorgonifer TaxID=2041049 RepID=A0AAE8MSV7_9PEZI|nr:uncharacterized protein DNG_01574 [Cephalotrichum gorgonifer]
MAPASLPKYFEPTAATASMFLYAQGPSVVCCHHDTLTIERRFARHSHEVQLLAVDNSSEIGAGRFVVSYDAGQNAIVWDLMTGDEIARFASYEHLTAAAWMRSGNVAFGNSQGTIILFEPTTSEHVSARTIDQIAVTALAPSGDCRTFAIGYQNGQCLVATLQPRFTILHNLTTSRTPSPIVTLQWHASSARQKSDMLASQTQDGDLRVWSVAKSYNSDDPAKVVRALRRNDISRPGPNWMGWSKNGRIIQYTDSETISWDVRTKHVTHDMIPTLENVRGLAVYGPGATLFTMGPNNTVQQFDLNAPAIMVANVQHPANLLPPSPPVSIEEQAEMATTIASESEITFNPSDVGISESEEEYYQPPANHGRDGYRADPRRRGADDSSVLSSRSGLSTASSARTPLQYQGSVRSQGLSEKTYISIGDSLAQGRQAPYKHSDMYSQSSLSTTSTRSNHRPSRLRNEVSQQAVAPVEARVDDLFKFTRSRLSDIPYKPPMQMNQGRLTNDHLRQQMLSTIFGWNKDIEDLIADEMSRHPNGSSSRIMLGKWLGYVDQDLMTTSSESMTSSDWMMLALSGIGRQQASQHKLGRAYVTTLLEKGDVHAAATILIGMGDHNDAIEIYISHKRFMEAIILTCLFFPSVWERQAAIIKRWGDFACSGQESTEPWASPSAAQLTFQNAGPSIGEILSPPLSPPSLNRGPQRQVGKNSALKLITSFDSQAGRAKFFSQTDDGQTPIAAGATPIAESAIDHNGDPTTAVMRSSNRGGFNTPTSTRSFASSTLGGRNPLPSIGESHGEGSTPIASRRQKQPENAPAGVGIQRAATASPMMMRDSRAKGAGREAPMPSPDPRVAARMKDAMENKRNGSRGRIPTGLTLQLDSLTVDDDLGPTSPGTSVASSARYHWPSRRRGPASVSSVTSASTNRSVRTTATGGRHLESYIHSLDAASERKKEPRGRAGSRDRGTRAQSEERGRTPVRAYPAKRSPTSPVPMSPEELGHLNSAKFNKDDPVPYRKQNASRASSRGTSRRPSQTRVAEEAALRSPISPPPMSAVPQLDDTEDEADYIKALEAQEKFRQRHNRSRGVTTPGKAEFPPQDVSQGRGRVTPLDGNRSQYQMYRGSSVEHMGDLKSVKEGRQRKKEQAARELEQRRKELSRTAVAGAIPHPNDLTPLPFRLAAVEMSSRGSDSPPRSRTADPIRSMYGRGATGSPQIGLPATPKAMRLVMDSDQTQEAVPPIPPSFMQGRSEEKDRAPSSPEKAPPRQSPQDQGEPLTLLPSSVYQPPRGPISRCMSAPIPDEPSNRVHRGPSRSGNMSRNGPSELRNINEHTSSSSGFARRGSYDDQVPPPPPPHPSGPPLRELQHLAMPPPPPPAPLPHVVHSSSTAAPPQGTIEIVMDEPEHQNQQPPVPPPAPAAPPFPSSTPIVIHPTEITVPVLPPPAPPSVKGHSRGRSVTDNSIAGRLSKATERLRSASRSSKKDNAYRAHKSPEFSPYESILPPMTYGQVGMRSPPPAGPIDPHNLPTGLNDSDLI